jgi:peptidoglycan-associated lipoprotein
VESGGKKSYLGGYCYLSKRGLANTRLLAVIQTAIRFMTLRTLTHTLLLATLALSSTSCAAFKKKKKSSSGSDSDFVQGTPLGGSDMAGGGGNLGSPLPERSEGSSFTSSGVDRHRFAPVHFGYDSYTVGGAEQSKVGAVAAALKGSSSSLIIAGFTDERGTAEYNRGLGERRAQAVRQTLIEKGLSASQIQTVSFGSEMPVDSASNESAWAKNRRAEFGVGK